MNLSIAKAASIAFFGLALAGLSTAQTYRQSYPLPDGSDLSGLCVNVNQTDLTDAQLQQIVDAGFKYVRYDFLWEGVERSRGVYNWTDVDRFMGKARAKGLRIMGLIAYSNEFYTTTGAPNTPESRAGYSAFAAAAAARYAHQGVIWEIFNEPNLTYWWPNANATDYASLANSAAQSIRAVSPDEWIIGLTVQTPAGWNNPYITTVLDSGVLENLDGIGFHPYTQLAPETMGSQWTEARNLVELRRPADKPIALMAGEVGFSRAWPGITPDVQATYTTRVALYNLCQGIGLTNVFSYSNLDESSDWHSQCGLTNSTTNAPYPAYHAIKRMSTALGGYKFSKRLNLTSANDYCMLFSNPNNSADTKVVVWTSGTPHTITVPSSVCNFSSIVLTSGATGSVSATSAGLSLAATGEPTVYTSQSANPLLKLAGSWGKLASTLTLSTRTDAIAQLGSLIVSPAWASAPVGTTLKIEDLPVAVPGYDRPSYTTTLSNLSTLTLNSASVQTVFNSLGSLQDAMDKGRTLRLTVQLPDGTAANQSATVVRQQPMSIFPTTPSNWALTLRVENPTGEPFSGIVKATSGVLSVPQPISFVQGETYKMLFFPTLNTALLGNDATYELYDNGLNVLDPARPVIDSAALTVFRAPNFVANTGWVGQIKGNAATAGSQAVTYGVADWLFLTGLAMANIDYSFGANGVKYITLSPPSSVGSRSFSKVPVSLGMWVKGDGSRNWLRTQLLDSAGQSFQATYGVVDWTGWKWVSVPLAGNLTDHWGGANDGVVRGAVRVLTPLILDSNWNGTGGRISLAGLTIVGQK